MNKITIEEYIREYSISEISLESTKLIDPKAQKGYIATQHATERYQRNVVWSDNLNVLYIESLIQDMAYSPIIIVDVDSCSKIAKQRGDEASEKQFQKFVGDGVKWLSIDGQNRSQSISGFVNNQYPIQGNFMMGRKVVDLKEKTFFRDLDVVQRDAFLNLKVSIAVVKNKTFTELKQMFTRLNSGVPLSSQEKRNATNTPVADWSREISKRYSSLSSLLFNEENIARMDDRREFSKVALALSHPKKDTTDDALNKYYNAGEGMLNLSEGYNSDILNDRIPKIFDIIQASPRQDQKKIKGKIFWIMCMAADKILSDKKKITNPRSFRLELEKRVEALSNASRKRLAADLADWEAAGENPYDKPKATNYFHSRLSHFNNQGPRNGAFREFYEGYSSSFVTKLEAAA
tara:strand:+ start:118 stop:1332 length:1215 start_codon:yes stop_codon:yes gene_type:complete